MSSQEKTSVLGIPVNSVTYDGVLSKIEEFIKSGGNHQIITVNPEIVLHSLKNNEMKEALLHSSLNTVDGIGIIMAGWYLSRKRKTKTAILHKVTGVDLIEKIAAVARDKKWRIFLVGGDPGVAEKTAQILKNKYRVGDIDFSDIYSHKDPRVIEEISNFKPDILLVAYGSPKQEIFIYKNLQKFNTKVAIGVGGSFDFISGEMRRAPKVMRRFGLEWLWRIILQPSRIVRIFRAVIIFPLKVLLSSI